MNNTMTNPTILALISVIRAMLVATGAVRGFMSDDLLTEFIGGLMVLIPVLWAIAEQYYLDIKAKHREVIAITAGIVIADNTVGPTPTIAPIDVPATIAAIKPQIVVTTPTAPPVVLAAA
jgi:hypothetical protein